MAEVALAEIHTFPSIQNRCVCVLRMAMSNSATRRISSTLLFLGTNTNINPWENRIVSPSSFREWYREWSVESTLSTLVYSFSRTCNLFVGMNWNGSIATATRMYESKYSGMIIFFYFPSLRFSVLSSFQVLSSCALDDFFSRRAK